MILPPSNYKFFLDKYMKAIEENKSEKKEEIALLKKDVDDYYTVQFLFGRL
jgi:hypothetical protein